MTVPLPCSENDGKFRLAFLDVEDRIAGVPFGIIEILKWR
jgi:hypothetical protein